MRASTAQLQYDAAMPSSAAERRGILVHMEVVLRFSSSFDEVVHEVANCVFTRVFFFLTSRVLLQSWCPGRRLPLLCGSRCAVAARVSRPLNPSQEG